MIKKIAYKLYPNTPLSIGEDLAKEMIALVTKANRKAAMDALDDAYANLGYTYTSLDMYDDASEAIEKALGDDNEQN